MKSYNNILYSLRAFALMALSTALLAACDEEEFARTAGQLPGTPDGIPTGALFAEGSTNLEVQDFAINRDTEIGVVYRLNFPAPEEITVSVSVGTQEEIDRYNDANGLEDKGGNHGYLHRYQMLPETNYVLPETMTLTVAKGKTESVPLRIGIVYDKNLLNSPNQNSNGKFMGSPLMLPLRTQVVQGTVLPGAAGPSFCIGVKPANLLETTINGGEQIEMHYPEQRPEKITYICFSDCRKYNPTYAIYSVYFREQYTVVELFPGFSICQSVPGTISYYSQFDIQCLRPAQISYDEEAQSPVLMADPDLMYVLTHQERYMDPQRNRHMKLCVSVEIEPRSPQGLCNLNDEARASLVWQIGQLVRNYRLDGVSLNDKGANYAAQGAPAVDKASYTKFLRDLRAALGDDKLILLSYRADENAALYEAHDGLRAGDYIDYAWWGVANTLCAPYAADATVKPIAGLNKGSFCPLAIETADTPQFIEFMKPIDEPPYTPKWVMQAQELYDAGQFGVGVDLGLIAWTQNFGETYYGKTPNYLAAIPLHESNGFNTEGWCSKGGSLTDFRNPFWSDSNAYGAGLKDW